jgi:hypothetical protein
VSDGRTSTSVDYGRPKRQAVDLVASSGRSIGSVDWGYAIRYCGGGATRRRARANGGAAALDHADGAAVGVGSCQRACRHPNSGNLQTGFEPLSGALSNGRWSITQNNTLAVGAQA